jgi:hypothetical protein
MKNWHSQQPASLQQTIRMYCHTVAICNAAPPAHTKETDLVSPQLTNGHRRFREWQNAYFVIPDHVNNGWRLTKQMCVHDPPSISPTASPSTSPSTSPKKDCKVT